MRLKRGTHWESAQGTDDLRNIRNPTLLQDREGDVPNLSKHESGSSYRCRTTPPTGESILHADAADLRQESTPFTGGRSSGSVCQQSSSNFQTSSEKPSFTAFAGFEGLVPPKT